MTPEHDFVSHVTRFCRALRSYGLVVSSQETADAIRALSLVDVMDRGRVYWTLRTLLVSRHEEVSVFDELFQQFWSFEPMFTRPATLPGLHQGGGMREFRPQRRGMLLPEQDSSSLQPLLQVALTGASAAEANTAPDLTVLHADELAELSRIATRLVRALASRPGRRRRRHPRKGNPDLRGAFRLSLATGGDLIRLPRMRRVPRVPRLLVLLDISGSMDRHTQLLLQLVYAVGQHTKRVEAFVFSTSATRVTRQLSAPSFWEALRRVGRLVENWSGGTRIGESLAGINAGYEFLQDRFTTVFLLSDGWETGDMELLSRELRRMRRRVRSIIWLNPLLGTRDYQPLARGLQTAMPYVDYFVSAMDVAHLKRVPQMLRA